MPFYTVRMAPSPTLRLAVPEDEPFLQALFSSRSDVALLPEPIRSQLIAPQWQAYRAQNEARKAETHVILQGTNPVGAIVLADEPDASRRIVDFTLMPSHRGQGIGRAVLSSLLENARVPWHLRVRPNNPAKRLYERLGFTISDGPQENTMDLSMHFVPRT